MSKSPIEIYLAKVASGDRSYLDRLCSQLADRLVYVPLAAPVRNEGRKTTITAFTLHDGARSIVPVFTSEGKFKNWCFEEGHNDASFSVLGGDLCAVLGSTSWITIDPLDALNVELDPETVKLVAASGQALPNTSGPIADAEIPASPEVLPITVRPVAVDETVVVSSAPVFSPPVKPSLVANPANATRTIIFSSTNALAQGSAVNATGSAPGSLTAAPMASAKEGPRKRSFLNFLKTGR